MNVSLTPELERFVQARVKSGRYRSASEVVREALRLLEEKETARQAALGEVRCKIEEGYQQSVRGQLVDGEAFFDELEGELRAPDDDVSASSSRRLPPPSSKRSSATSDGTVLKPPVVFDGPCGKR